MSYSVEFKNVTKRYKMYKNSTERLKGVWAPKKSGEDFYAVKNISFAAKPGDVIGIVGVNGAGKSTLSNIIAGIVPETSGEFKINGKVSVISVSSGLDGELTGLDNIRYKCLMLGFSTKEINRMLPDIIDFADIGNFIDQPVKNYSSGMKSRLGFAIAINIDPDVLVIDEALSVGDQTFREKCFEKMNEFKEQGKTIFFVSHSLNQVRDFCNKVLWLEAGEVRGFGERIKILPQYRKFLKEFRALSPEDQKNFRNEVAERRSRFETVEETEGTDEVLPGNPFYKSDLRSVNKKKSRNLGSLMTTLILITALIIALILVKPWNLLNQQPTTEPENDMTEFEGTIAGGIVGVEGQEEKEPVEDDLSQEVELIEEDIRYVTVDSGSIREIPSLDGGLIGLANFGEAYFINDSEEGIDGIEWLNISLINTEGGENGWISGNIMQDRQGTVPDAELAQLLLPLVGSNQALEDLLNVNQINSIEETIIPIMSVSREMLVDQIGEADLESENILLYHGTSYDYVFVLENEMITELTIREMIVVN